MPVDRPTFSESWYRVVDLKPRLRNSVQIHRQHYRNQTWYVIQDPANNQFYRLNAAGYHFVGMLDGRRGVGEVWKACNETLGDEAPTQGEAIQLLGQLYVSNLIQADLPPDTEGMFNRYRKRKTREVQGYLMNLLFIRIPLLDPDAFLNRWVKLFGILFSPVGAVLWAAMIAVGFYFLAGHWGELIAEGQARDILSPDNLIGLYLASWLIKGFHEFGHAFACKRFGVRTNSGGEVHTMGIMFMVFTPLPYVDATSSWAFPSKWHRMVVGMGGMIVELFLAAIAAIIWTQTPAGTQLHTVMYNVIFIAGVSTVLFNANPLLRYDGYYILSDLLEIPNLWQRSREYLYYLVKKYAWGVRRPRCPSQSASEKVWLSIYAVASTVYRFVVYVAILLFVASALPVVGMVLAVAAGIAGLVVPAVKFVHYLLLNSELFRVRTRAILTTFVTITGLALLIGLVGMPEHISADGISRAADQPVIFARSDGFLQSYLPSYSAVTAEQEAPLLKLDNPQLAHTRRSVELEIARLQEQKQDQEAQAQYAQAQQTDQMLQVAQAELKYVDEQINLLTVRPDKPGVWYAPKLEYKQGSYLKPGDNAGVIVNLDDMVVEAVVTQEEAARIFSQPDSCVGDCVQMRLPGLPEATLHGTVIEKVPAGQRDLPSPALSAQGGGNIALAKDGNKGQTAAPFFKVVIKPDMPLPENLQLLSGQRVAIRFDLPPRPLAQRAYRKVLQLMQKF